MASFYYRAKNSGLGRTTAGLFAYRRTILFAAGSSYFAIQYVQAKIHAARRDKIHPNTLLYWRFHDGSIVEQRTAGSNLSLLLNSSGPGEEPGRILTLFEVERALKWIESDDRIAGIVADFSSNGSPNVPPYKLGLAQIEEIHGAMANLKKSRKEADLPLRTIAVTDTFSSQGDYVLATAFDEVYLQPSGEIPLTGLGASIPFYSRLLSWLGIKVHAEARTHWKSMVAPYTQTELSEEQAANEVQLLSDLNDNMLTLIARSRYPTEEPEAALSKLKSLTFKGPFSAKEAQSLGLINQVAFKSKVLLDLIGESSIEDADIAPKDPAMPRLHGFYHYVKTMDRAIEKSGEAVMDVGIVYLLGTIGGDAGEFGTSSVIRGLKEAARDDEIRTVILRIDSGGGGVVESESIWDAVNQLRAKGKIVIASFANAAASGGYLVATHADLVCAHPSTITGSIGVASLRPTVTQTFLDRFYLNVQSFFTGSKSQSLLHELEGDELDRHRQHVDEMYDMFKGHVCDGRAIAPEEVEAFAGGRVFSGLRAYGFTAPADLLEQLKRDQNLLPLRAEPAAEDVAALAELEAAPAVQLDPDQSMSPFAPVIEEGEIPPPEVEFDMPPEPQLGPKGRGLVDMLGGLFDAASIGAELGIVQALSQAKQMYPDMDDFELIETVLPGQNIQQADDGSAVFAFDIRLRSYPRERGLWAAALQAARRGDAMDPDVVSIWHAGKIALFSFLVRSVGQSLSQELEGLGLPVQTLTTRDTRRVESQLSVSVR